MRITAIVALVLSVTAISAQLVLEAQQGDRVTLRGVLVDAGHGGALPRARVNVTSRAQSVASALTDGDGRFSVSVAPGAPVALRIVKAGYAAIIVPVTPEQLRASDPLRIAVPRGAVITGRVVDPGVEPSPVPIQMVVVRRLTSGGAASSEEPLSVSPDDRGEYRVSGLAAGRYAVTAFGPGSDGSISYSDIVSGVAQSITVDLQAGIEAAGIDLVLQRRLSEPVATAAQPDPPGSTVRGRVTTTDGVPVVDATVTATTRPGRLPVAARTDAVGSFTLRGIAPGPLTVRANKRGYVTSQHGQRGTELPGLPVMIEAGKDVDDLSIVLPRSGVISGMVIDEDGEALQEAGVQLLRVRRQQTGALVALREQGSIVRRTDDRGQFRLSGIGAGDYIVMASLPVETVDPAAPLRTAYVPVYHPDTPDFAGASPIRIADGEDIPGLILTMRRAPVVRVAGVARNSQGLPFTGTVRLTPRHVGAVVPAPREVHPEPSGEFAFADVPPGDYLVRTLVVSGPAGPEFAAGHVTVVDRDPEPLTIRTSPGSSVSGRIVLEGGGGDPLWGYSVSSAPVDPGSSPGSTSSLSSPVSTGEPFTLYALAGPMRLRVWSDDQKWYLKSILINGFDVADMPFDFGFDGRAYSDVEVVFSRGGASITGRATDDRAAPVRDYAVYVFATDREKWVAGSRWVKLARASADGAFNVLSLPPGDYWAAAVDRVDESPAAADWVDANLLENLSSRATRLSLGEGQSRDLTLRLIRR